MTTNDSFDRRLEDWLVRDSAHRVPEHLDEVLVQTIATRQRAWWSSPERWLPMDITAATRTADLRPFAILALVGAIIIGSLGVAAVANQRPVPAFGAAENGRIYVADGRTVASFAADGTDRQVVVDLPDQASAVVVSPDGSRLAVAVSAEPARIDILDIGSGRSTTIPMPAMFLPSDQIAWSPSSDRIAFPAIAGNDEFLLVAPVDGGVARLVGEEEIDPDLGIWWPAWSPTGDRLAFVGVPSKPGGTGDIYVLDPDGTGLQRLVTPSLGPQPMQIAWSPDPAAELILYTAVDPNQVRVIDVATGTDTHVTWSWWPTWSPTGDRISFWGTEVMTTEEALSGGSDTIVVIEAWTDGGFCLDHPELKDQSFCGPAAWSPDGTRLIAADITGTSILSVMADGSGAPIVMPLEDPAADVPWFAVAWQPIVP